MRVQKDKQMAKKRRRLELFITLSAKFKISLHDPFTCFFVHLNDRNFFKKNSGIEKGFKAAAFLLNILKNLNDTVVTRIELSYIIAL